MKTVSADISAGMPADAVLLAGASPSSRRTYAAPGGASTACAVIQHFVTIDGGGLFTRAVGDWRPLSDAKGVAVPPVCLPLPAGVTVDVAHVGVLREMFKVSPAN
jgi:hypothetical protein